MGFFSDWLKSRKPAPEVSGEEEMSFFDHLEELRKHIFRIILVLLIISIVMFIYRNEIFQTIFFSPLYGDWFSNRLLCKLSDEFCFDKIQVTMQALSPSEQFNKAMVYAFFGGLIMGMPYVLWEIWRFIKPGLRKAEVRAVNSNVLWMSILFFLGVSFGYFVVLPFSLYFFSQFTLVDGIENNWRIGEYISFLLTLILGSGLLFQLPVAVYYLARIGLISSAFMRKYRRHAIVIILIIAAIFTPPDPLSQIFLAIPMYFLYEMSIGVCRRVEKRRDAEDAARLKTST